MYLVATVLDSTVLEELVSYCFVCGFLSRLKLSSSCSGGPAVTSLPLSILVVTEDSEQGASLVICGGPGDTHTAGFQVAWEGPASAHRP